MVKHQIYQKTVHQRVHRDSHFVLLFQTDLCVSTSNLLYDQDQSHHQTLLHSMHIPIFYFLDHDWDNKIFYKISRCLWSNINHQ